MLPLDDVDRGRKEEREKGREEVKQVFGRLPLLLILSLPWQESARLVQTHYPICTICQTKGAMGPKCLWHGAGLSDGRKTCSQLSVSL